MISVILAGGVGRRLWPLSTPRTPKHFLKLFEGKTLFEMAVERARKVSNKIIVVCSENQAKRIKRMCLDATILAEPMMKNTAPAVAFAALSIEDKDEVMLIMPSDHYIKGLFEEDVREAERVAKDGFLVTFGIKPEYPETGYGYIELGERISGRAFKVKRFVEKPQPEKAEEFLKAGRFFWNSGIFAFKVSVILEELAKYTDILDTLSLDDLKGSYKRLTEISIDYAVMERSKRVAIVPANFKWNDVGSFSSLYSILPKDGNGNVIIGDAIALDCRNSLVISTKGIVGVIGVESVGIILSDEGTIVLDLGRSQDVKKIV